MLEMVKRVETDEQMEALIGEERIIETSAVKSYWKDLQYAHALDGDERFSVFVGPAGVGKSTIARLFAAKNAAAYIYAPPRTAPGCYSSRRLLEEICRRIELSSVPHHCMDMVYALIEHLQQHPKTILLDNANSICSYHVFDPLKFIHDATGARFVFIGTWRLRQWLAMKGMEEFASRVRWYREVAPATAKDLQKAFPGYAPDVIARIHEVSGGIMREVVAHLADLSKLTTAGGQVLPADAITVKVVNQLADGAWRKVP